MNFCSWLALTTLLLLTCAGPLLLAADVGAAAAAAAEEGGNSLAAFLQQLGMNPHTAEQARHTLEQMTASLSLLVQRTWEAVPTAIQAIR